MTYRELQQQLKTLRSEGRIPASFKLNQKKATLQAMWDKIQYVNSLLLQEESNRVWAGIAKKSVAKKLEKTATAMLQEAIRVMDEISPALDQPELTDAELLAELAA